MGLERVAFSGFRGQQLFPPPPGSVLAEDVTGEPALLHDPHSTGVMARSWTWVAGRLLQILEQPWPHMGALPLLHSTCGWALSFRKAPSPLAARLLLTLSPGKAFVGLVNHLLLLE